MLLIFILLRPDVFPVSDLEIQQAIQKLLKTEKKGKELMKQMNTYSEKWKPYQTFAAVYLWKWKDKNNF